MRCTGSRPISRRAGIAAGHRHAARTGPAADRTAAARRRGERCREGAAAARARHGSAAGPGRHADRRDSVRADPAADARSGAGAAPTSTRPITWPPRRCSRPRRRRTRAARTAFLPSLHVNGEAGRVGVDDLPTPTSSTACAASVRGSGVRARPPAGPARDGRPPICSAAARCWPTCAAASTSTSGRRSSTCTPPSRRSRRPVSGASWRREQLAQSRDRFSAGVAGSLEVVQSQEARRGRKRQLHICALRAQHRQGDPRTCRRCGGGRNQGVSRRRTLMADTRILPRARCTRGEHAAQADHSNRARPRRCRRPGVVVLRRARVDRRRAGGRAHHADLGPGGRQGGPCRT